MIEISQATRNRIEALFPQREWQRVEQLLLQECGDNLPLVKDTYTDLAERVRFAVLKLSNGSYDDLAEQVRLAATDWRDTLVAAGFADDTQAHLRWLS
jgi:hypothetical protein